MRGGVWRGNPAKKAERRRKTLTVVGRPSTASMLRYVGLTPGLSPSWGRPGATIAVTGPILLTGAMVCARIIADQLRYGIMVSRDRLRKITGAFDLLYLRSKVGERATEERGIAAATHLRDAGQLG